MNEKFQTTKNDQPVRLENINLYNTVDGALKMCKQLLMKLIENTSSK